MPDTDRAWMARALELAERGRGAVEPNPLVGAVVVRDGAAIGEGWHQRFGGPHAEVFALDAAGLRAGVARVVAAMSDPFPRVAGGGLAQLRAAGVTVEVGLCEAEARRLN